MVLQPGKRLDVWKVADVRPKTTGYRLVRIDRVVRIVRA